MAYQGVYKRHETHVVVKAFKITSENTLNVGEELDVGSLPVYQMRSLFRRKIIGKKDSPWANEMLEKAMSAKKVVKKDEDKVEKKPKKPRKKADKGIG
jgi:hypothetical protein